MKFGNDTWTGMTGNLTEKSTIDVTADQTDADYFVAKQFFAMKWACSQPALK